jgi:hypothetical protein
MNFVEMRLIPHEKMGREAYWHTKEACEQSKKHGSKSLPKSYMKVVSKNANSCKKINRGRGQQSR